MDQPVYPYFVQSLNKIQLPGAARNELGRLRTAVTVFFTVDGFIFASWAVRIPAVKAAVGASPAALGLALLGVSGGAIATMAITGMLCRRFGAPLVTVVAATWLSLGLLLPPLAHSAAALGGALVVFGIGYGGLNVAMNTVAVDLVAAMRRPVMPSFHAAWSFGGLAGAAIGGILAPHLRPFPHLALVALAGLVVTATAGPVLLRTSGALVAVRAAPEEDTAEAAAAAPVPAGRPGELSRALVRRVVVMSGLIALCGSYGEGAIGDWGALHLRQDLGAGAGLAAAGYAAFALAEACGRLGGSRLLARFGQTKVIMAGGFTACAGMLLAALAPVIAGALLGFALTGLGVSNLFPAAMTRAGALAGPTGVAVASTLGYAGFLLGPPAIGFLASRVSLSIGLTTVSGLALAAVVIAYLSRDHVRGT
jgi:MFS family permease